MIFIRIILMLLAAYSAGILAAVFLVPDVFVQVLFMLPVALYFYFVFRGVLQQRLDKRGDVAHSTPDLPKGLGLPLIDITAILCGSVLVYLGFTAPMFRQFDDMTGSVLAPSLLPSVDINSLIAGVALLSIGLSRLTTRKLLTSRN